MQFLYTPSLEKYKLSTSVWPRPQEGFQAMIKDKMNWCVLVSGRDVWTNQTGKQLKTLEESLEELRSSTTGKTKFAFKRKVKIPASTSAETATPPAPANTPAIPTSTISSASRTISDHSNCYLSRSCLSSPSSSTDHIEVSIIRISNSILNLATTNELTPSANTVSLSALHIHDIENSILVLGTVDGSIMLHNLTNCVVVAECHQVGYIVRVCYTVPYSWSAV